MVDDVLVEELQQLRDRTPVIRIVESADNLTGLKLGGGLGRRPWFKLSSSSSCMVEIPAETQLQTGRELC